MANAKKLKSGAWRTQAFKMINGKKVVKSFTVNPKDVDGVSLKARSQKAKMQSELMAREWQLSQNSAIMGDITVKQAIEGYIEDKSKVLSPSTIRGYKLVLSSFENIWDVYISDIDTPQIQRIINDLAMDLKTKTIKNRVTLLLAVLDYSGIDKKFKVRYPQNNSKKVTTPDIDDVKMFISNSKGDLTSIIYLAAFGSLRRGEIAGLQEKDISRDMNTVTVSGDIILSPEGWVYKDMPKTQGSRRTIQLPKFVIESIPQKDDPEAFIFDLTPAAMSDRFKRLADKLQLPYTLHSLRHFAASFRTDLGIPSKYVQEVGGWVDESAVFSKTYDNAMDSSRKKYTQIANRFIEDTFKEQKQA